MKKLLFKNIDNAPLVIFRMFLGFLIACESFGAILTGWVTNTLVAPKFTFSFIGLEWLQPLPENGMYVYFIAMGILGLCIMLGYRYVITMSAYTILWAGVYFMQKTSYNNHYYLLLMVCFIMIFLPANKDKSYDATLGYTKRQQTMPSWIRFLFILLIGIVYTYASIAKFYPDWLNGTFTKNLMKNATYIPYLSEHLFVKKWFYLFLAYTGIIFDMFIVPLLLIKRTRTIALLLSLVFHIFNSITLQIGIFPYFALSFVLFFYEPERMRKLFFKNNINIKEEYNFYGKKLLYFLFIPFLAIQLLLPLRHHFIKGDVLYTEEGHRLSWRMMLRNRSGYITINIIDKKTNKKTNYNYRNKLTPKQQRQLATKPDFIWQFCQRIKKEYKNEAISIYISCKNSVNAGSYFYLIDPKYDMATAKWNYFSHNEWIIAEKKHYN